MFQDIVQLTQLTLIATLEDKTKKFDKKQLYDVYRALQQVVAVIQGLEVHYYPSSLQESFLQNLQHSMPSQKWIMFVEQDFNNVRQALRHFLVELINLTYIKINEDGFREHVSIIEYCIKAKHIFGFFSYHYESGKLAKNEQSILHHKLYMEQTEFYKEFAIDISTHKQRVSLGQNILASRHKMKEILDTIRSFILQYATLEELL